MPFLNKYNHSSINGYSYSIKVLGSIYSVGSQTNTNVISRFNLDGSIIWEKSFGTEEFDLTKIIGCSNNTDIIAIGSGSGFIVLLRINSQGDIIWKKSIIVSASSHISDFKEQNNLLNLGNENYILAYKQDDSENVNPFTVIIKFDGDGVILTRKKLDFIDFKFDFESITLGNDKIVLYGNTIPNSNYQSKAFIIEMSFGLDIILNIIESSSSVQTIKYLKYHNQSIITRCISTDGTMFLVKFQAFNGNINIEKTKHYSGIKVDNTKSNSSHIYLETCNNIYSLISKIDYDFNPIWTKRFDYINIQKPTGILCEVTEEELIINNTTSFDFQNSVIGLLDLDLNSCKTKDDTLIQVTDKMCTFSILDTSYDLIEINVSFSDISVPVISLLESIIEPVCESLVSCVKDEEICSIYSNIYSTFTRCIQFYGQQENPEDFVRYKNCFEEFLKNINEIKDHDFKEIAPYQLDSIYFFIGYEGKEKKRYYEEALSAVYFILNYLSQQGNCNCENSLVLTDKSMLQSGHFYIQAAGSVGEDSTKGVHLRWALRNVLSDHLPKGNYASTTFRFNKPNDFVKIYKAKYSAYRVSLDFREIPTQVNDTVQQKNWVYDLEGKIFYVHFRDLVKYDATRNLINPNIDPLNFITNYGDSLIEIETKSELSFRIVPKFYVENSNCLLKVELLSVEKNTLTAPKTASLRRKYKVDDISNIVLTSENIRSFRFTSSFSHILSVEYEFYSDFIKKTSENREWSYMGKYALTKETNIAYQRLEPKPNCLVNWLRYNERAYVNPSNYKHRWDSDDLNSMERISSGVAKYIELSDEFDNPKALDYFPYLDESVVEACNLSNPDFDPENPEYDPYIPETPSQSEATGMEISYLELLQMSSMDYHIARMLGLGCLDLDPITLEGVDNMYLAEYVTYGDLQDGLGAREVQHLFCSLPTTIYDQRLSLPVDLEEPKPGMFYFNGYEEGDSDEEDDETDTEQNDFSAVELTSDGYSPDGKTRYYSFFIKPISEEFANAPFYYKDDEFTTSEHTSPVFAGLEHKYSNDEVWLKPELSFHADYFNIDTSGVPSTSANETFELTLPERYEPIHTIAVKQSEVKKYSSYGINWFSRATNSSIIHTVETIIKPKNELLPPTNITATLVQNELPLLLTTTQEQSLYELNPREDKTIVRLTFEYNHAQELINYHQKNNDEMVLFYTEPEKESFAKELLIYFRNHVPNGASGKIASVTDNSNPLLTDIVTSSYTFSSTGETVTPFIPVGSEDNYIGSILIVNGKEFVIHEIDNTGLFPNFTVFKTDASGALLNLNSLTDENLEILDPELGALFMTVENMQNTHSWGNPNPSVFTINIDLDDVHREGDLVINNVDCSTETHVQKFRGVYEPAKIEKVLERVDENGDGEYDKVPDGDTNPDNDVYVLKHLGLYKITFDSYRLAQHSQYFLDVEPGRNSVEWYNGVVRLHTLGNENGMRKEFKVVGTENIGIDEPLVLYIEDLSFPSNPEDLIHYKGKLLPHNIDNGINEQKVNYYPGYKVYLYEDSSLGLNEDNVLPIGDDEVRYTIFGMMSKDFANEHLYDNTEDYFSKMSAPTLMFANAIREPLPPQKPSGGVYATRPDYFGKASYTFRTKYGTEDNKHKPHSVQFNRASDIQFLSAIYKNDPEIQNDTLQMVMRDIFLNREEDYYVDRWNNLLSFDYGTEGLFAEFDGRRLPMPDNAKFIEGINDFIKSHNDFYNLWGTPDEVAELSTFNLSTEVIPALSPDSSSLLIKHFLKETLHNCFVPLTEIPILYNYVNGTNYTPIPKKQVIRDGNGNLLNPEHPDFDIAPMMKRIDPHGEQYESQFTDFGLDGASNTTYFYAAREISSQLKVSDFSGILGPVSLVNTAPPTSPEIVKVVPILENRVLGISPSVELRINSYSKSHKIRKVCIYRATNAVDAMTVRTMKLIKTADVEIEQMLDNEHWVLQDDFSDLMTEIPFGDPLFYRLTVMREIKYADKEGNVHIDYAPSEVSKLCITNIVENYNPVSPILDYFSEELNDNSLQLVTLHWEKTCYNAKYHVYKMNSQGNWVKIHQFQTNDEHVFLPLEVTELQTNSLIVFDDNDNNIYHHFKVIAENTSGMFSSQEHILTIYNSDTWKSIGGIGDMIIDGTFYIR